MGIRDDQKIAIAPKHFDTAAIAQSVERLVSNRKVADSWFDSRAGNTSLYPRKRRFLNAYHHSGQAVYLLWWSSWTKDLQIEPQKGGVRWWVRRTQGAWLVRTNGL